MTVRGCHAVARYRFRDPQAKLADERRGASVRYRVPDRDVLAGCSIR